jgi:hypothetical protein
MRSLDYKNFMQGNKEVMLSELESAAKQAGRNDDEFLARMVEKRGKELQEWAIVCTRGSIDEMPGAFATSAANPIP